MKEIEPLIIAPPHVDIPNVLDRYLPFVEVLNEHPPLEEDFFDPKYIGPGLPFPIRYSNVPYPTGDLMKYMKPSIAKSKHNSARQKRFAAKHKK